MRRFILLLFLGLGLTVGLGTALLPTEPVEAVTPGQVVGIYRLRLKGDGFHRDNLGRVRDGRIRGLAEMRITDTDTERNNGEFQVEIRLHPGLDGSLIDALTPATALKGRGVLVGDTLTVIGTAVPSFVNVVYLRFLRKGRKVTGTWMTSFPAAADADSTFAGGAGVAFVGKRVRKPAVFQGAPEFSFSRTDSVQAR